MLNLICHVNNTSSCQLKDLSDMKCMLAIREDRKEQAEVVGYMEIDVRRVELAPGLHSFPELRLNTFTVLLLWQQVSGCTNIRPEVIGDKILFVLLHDEWLFIK